MLGSLTMKLSLSSLLVHPTGINHEDLRGKSTRIRKGWQCPMDTACWHCPYLFPDVMHAVTWKNIEAWEEGIACLASDFYFYFIFSDVAYFYTPVLS